MNNLKKIAVRIAGSKYLAPVFIFVFALVFRLMYMSTFKNAWMRYGFPESDARSIDIVAMNILNGRGIVDLIQFFPYYSYRAPLCSIFLSMIYGFFGHNFFLARIFQCVISSMTAAIVYFISLKALRNKSAAITSGIITAVYMHFIYYAYSLLTETLFIFFGSLSVLLLLSGVQNRSWRICAWSGVISAATVLTREVFISVIPAFALWIIIVCLHDRKCAAKLTAGFVVGCVLILLPLLIRNYYVHGKPLLGSVGMRHLWNGADPKHMGDYFSERAWRESLWINPYANESERINMEMPKALKYIKRYPSLYLSFCKQRFGNFWRLPGNPLEQLRLNAKPLDVLLKMMRSLTNLIIPFGVLGFLLSIRRWRESLLFGGTIVFFSAFHSIFGGTERFRIPIDWVFIIYASLMLQRLFTFGRNPLMDDAIDDAQFFNARTTTPSNIRKWAIRIAAITGAGIIAAYLIMVLPQYFKHEEPFDGYITDVAKVESVIKETGHYEQWLKQDKALYTVQKLIEKRLKESSPDDYYDPWIVAWTGEMHYISKKKRKTEYFYFSFCANAHGRYPGDGRFRCYLENNAVVEVPNPNEGEVVTIVGYTTDNSLGAPRIQVLGVLPYKQKTN